jgi:hypothetical protein
MPAGVGHEEEEEEELHQSNQMRSLETWLCVHWALTGHDEVDVGKCEHSGPLRMYCQRRAWAASLFIVTDEEDWVLWFACLACMWNSNWSCAWDK